jgi:hypothetical protein
VSSREQLDDGRADGSGAANHDDAHETALRSTLSSPHGAAPRHRDQAPFATAERRESERVVLKRSRSPLTTDDFVYNVEALGYVNCQAPCGRSSLAPFA